MKCGNSIEAWPRILLRILLKQLKCLRIYLIKQWKDSMRMEENKIKRNSLFRALISMSPKRFKFTMSISRETLAKIMSHQEAWRLSSSTNSFKSKVSWLKCQWSDQKSKLQFTTVKTPRRDWSNITTITLTWQDLQREKRTMDKWQMLSQSKITMTIL